MYLLLGHDFIFFLLNLNKLQLPIKSRIEESNSSGFYNTK